MSTSTDVIGASSLSGTHSGKQPNLFLYAGIVLLVVSFGLLFIGSESDPARPYTSWIIGISFWSSILVGMLFLLMIGWMFDAGWSVILRRQFEHMISAFPYIGLIFLPLVIMSVANPAASGVPWIWMNSEALVPGGKGVVGGDVLYVHKAPYLNQIFFLLRYIAIFAVWGGLAYLFRKWSFNMDRTGDHANIHNSRKLAAVGLFLCAFATTLASVDWLKSLSYHWFSTMYGVWFFAASMRAALSAIVLLMFYQMTKEDGLKGLLKPTHFYFVGCLMLAFTVFWAYISFSQYFLIYSANIPEETFWYNIREVNKDGTKNSWWWVSLALVFLHFLLPFLYLLFYNNKFGQRIKLAAIWILSFHLLDLYWNIVPQKLAYGDTNDYSVRPFGIHLADITVLLGIGAIVLWAYLRSASRERPIPIRDPRINEALNCHE